MYDKARWRKLRLAILADEPLCRLCTEKGRTVLATVVDHIVAHKEDEDLMWGRENLRPLCKTCHDRKTALIDNDGSFAKWSRIPEWIKPPIIPVTLVCGPPGSGKTVYCEKNCGRNSLLIDLDHIAAEISGGMVHEVDMSKWLGPAMRARNELLAGLSKPQARNYTDCWFVVLAPRLSERRKWARLLRPKETVIMETGRDTCLERTKSRGPSVQKAVSTWWKHYTSDLFNETQVVSG